MEANVIFTQLKEALENYLSAKAEDERVSQIEKKHEKLLPVQSIIIESEADLMKYVKALTIHKRHIERIHDLKLKYGSRREWAYKALLQAVPIRNTWFKIQVNGDAYAVGTCWDIWGGGHVALELEPWKDDLARIPDRTYYP